MSESKLVPREPTYDQLLAMMEADGAIATPYPDQTESGMVVEQGLSAEDCDTINEEIMEQYRRSYKAAIAAAPPPGQAPPTPVDIDAFGKPCGEGVILPEFDSLANDAPVVESPLKLGKECLDDLFEEAKRDDWHRFFIGSDIRLLIQQAIAAITLREQLAQAQRELAECKEHRSIAITNCKASERERDDLLRHLNNLMARIFRDGGQIQDSFPTVAEACDAANKLCATYIQDRDELAAKLARFAAEMQTAKASATPAKSAPATPDS